MEVLWTILRDVEDRSAAAWTAVTDLTVALGAGVYGPYAQASLLSLLLGLMYAYIYGASRGAFRWPHRLTFIALVATMIAWRLMVADVRLSDAADSVSGEVSAGIPVMAWTLIVLLLIVVVSIVPGLIRGGGAVCIIAMIVSCLVAVVLDVTTGWSLDWVAVLVLGLLVASWVVMQVYVAGLLNAGAW